MKAVVEVVSCEVAFNCFLGFVHRVQEKRIHDEDMARLVECPHHTSNESVGEIHFCDSSFERIERRKEFSLVDGSRSVRFEGEASSE